MMGADNGLVLDQLQGISKTNADKLGTVRTNLSEIWIKME